MARIAEKNPKYRSKEELCKDLSIILNNDKITYGTKMAVIDNMFWVWSEFHGKIKGCKYWSIEAVKAYQKNKKAKLIHEHIVPRKILREKIFDIDKVTPESIKKLFDTYNIGVIVTKAEDDYLNRLGLRSKMPDDWDGLDPWARHKAGNIKLAQ